MSVFPVGASVGWIVFRPVLDELPEGLGVFFVLSDGVGADESINEGEAVRFPDEFDVSSGVVGDLGPVLGRVEFDAGNGVTMPVGREVCVLIGVREVFELAVEKFV